jgi:hypothetical protein
VCPLPAIVMVCVPSELPLSSHIVAVTLADPDATFARATPIVKPAVLSKGRVTMDDKWLCSGTVPSDTGLLGLLVRKIA